MQDFDPRKAGAAVEIRMAELRVNRAEMTRRSGLDGKTLKSIIDGSRMPSFASTVKLEDALGWEHGEYQRRGAAVHGRATDPAPSHEPTLSQASTLELLAELTKRAARETGGTLRDAAQLAIDPRSFDERARKEEAERRIHTRD